MLLIEWAIYIQDIDNIITRVYPVSEYNLAWFCFEENVQVIPIFKSIESIKTKFMENVGTGVLEKI